VIFGSLGVLVGNKSISYPMYTAFKSESLGWLFPMLFITVACGAISGFHSLVASGTSSKQIDREEDALFIGYGGMLLEGVVAVIAISTVIMLTMQSDAVRQQPLAIFATGMGEFFKAIKLNPRYGVHFGLLALSAFVLTTLDTATRIGRYVFQEFFNISGSGARFIATIATITIPMIMIFVNFTDANGNPVPAWKIIWPLFGSTNQLLGALALLVVYVWLSRIRVSNKFILIPMVFMLVVTLLSLYFLINKFRFSSIGIIAILLFILAIYLIFEAIRIVWKIRSER
jgi:carbon starvation protein